MRCERVYLKGGMAIFRGPTGDQVDEMMVGGEGAVLKKKPSKVSAQSFSTIQTRRVNVSSRQVVSPRRTHRSCDSSRVTRLPRQSSVDLLEKQPSGIGVSHGPQLFKHIESSQRL